MVCDEYWRLPTRLWSGYCYTIHRAALIIRGRGTSLGELLPPRLLKWFYMHLYTLTECCPYILESLSLPLLHVIPSFLCAALHTQRVCEIHTCTCMYIPAILLYLIEQFQGVPVGVAQQLYVNVEVNCSTLPVFCQKSLYSSSRTVTAYLLDSLQDKTRWPPWLAWLDLYLHSPWVGIRITSDRNEVWAQDLYHSTAAKSLAPSNG